MRLRTPVGEYVERFNAGDLVGLRRLFADDAVVHGVLGWGGVDEVMPIWEQLVQGLAMQRGRSRAPFFDKPATGASYELVAMEWFVIEAGKIQRRWGARDSASQARQLGWDVAATLARPRGGRRLTQYD